MAGFHDYEMVVSLDELLAWDKAALFETAMCSFIPVQSPEVNSLHAGLRKDIVQQGNNGICSVALIPVGFVPDHDTHLCFLFDIIQAEITAIADVLSLNGLNG